MKARTSSSMGVSARLVAVDVLRSVIGQGLSLKAALADVLPTLPDRRDRALVEALVFCVLRHYPAYQTTIDHWMARPLQQRQFPLKLLIMVGMAQLEHIGIAEHAVVSATVESCRALGFSSHRPLVNALLRRVQREGIRPVGSEQLWPSWLRQRIQSDWPEHAEAVFAASIRSAPMWLRVNAQRESAEHYRQRLRACGIAATLSQLAPQALCLSHSVPVNQLPGFERGDVSVQDFSAQLVADVLAPAPYSRILDACAAPGGKTAHLLERDPSLDVTAIDVDNGRMQRLIDGCARLHLHPHCRVADMQDLSSWWDKRLYDAVVLDAPCSATGVVRRHPDLLLHRQPADIDKLVNVQANLLDACWTVLKPGGTLVYTTCSVLHSENHLQIASFAMRTSNARILDPGNPYGHFIQCCRQRFPGENNADGFFYAKLVKSD